MCDEEPLTFLPLTFSQADANACATHLILTLFPHWDPAHLDFIRFTDGITNTLLKCVHKTITNDPVTGAEKVSIDEMESALLRAYGKGTNVLIDRGRECQNHFYLALHSLAPPLLARFNNGLIYRFVPGRVTSPADLSLPKVYTAVAKRLGQWHAQIDTKGLMDALELMGPRRRISPDSGVPELVYDDIIESDEEAFLREGGSSDGEEEEVVEEKSIKPGESELWLTLQKWISALPEHKPEEIEQKKLLRDELEWIEDSTGLSGLGEIVFGHCDLLSGNVIVLPKKEKRTGFCPADIGSAEELQVTFIDYEYAIPTERAFDIANHFSEWTGFDCDYNLIPTSPTRRSFIKSYLESFSSFKSDSQTQSEVTNEEIDEVMREVDSFRGIPGFYWGIWALIQATISQIDFDYAAYAELRLAEYWDWKKAFLNEEREQSLRERRWLSL
ncbi:hypothetical protein TWF192_004663 [Orbilia oligospora]|uniref:ethanolamine kinase n=1 Tax=Orbilia oligospora TaxID=2813651 RepID=A0A6G1LQ37_ORBOL|nr:hypothetical protein TWF191_010765 [Orbilia oligospora]KAF3221361.1 hypothetical protein TWF679_008051 [Orbilia oligospora]KAF3230482.1 hypothetical protein TWF192_004663 [Orbilia oligospora]